MGGRTEQVITTLPFYYSHVSWSMTPMRRRVAYSAYPIAGTKLFETAIYPRGEFFGPKLCFKVTVTLAAMVNRRGPKKRFSGRARSGQWQQPRRKRQPMKKRESGAKEGKVGDTPSQLIDARIKELRDWRGEALARVRMLVKQADPEMIEEWKWRGVPVWSHAGIICTGETYKNVVKMTFAKGAALTDPSGLFNASLEGNTRRAIDLHEGDEIDEKALKALIRAAVALNISLRAGPVRARKKTKSV
jgi:hypothetical protein